MKQRVLALSLTALLLLISGCQLTNPSGNSAETTGSCETFTDKSFSETKPATDFVPVITTPEAVRIDETAPPETTVTEATAAITTAVPETTVTEPPVTTSITTAATTPAETTVTTTVPAVVSTEPIVSSLQTVVTTALAPKPPADIITRGYSYRKLTPEYREVYDYIVSAIEKHETVIRFQRSVPLSSLRQLYCAILWEEPISQCLDPSTYYYNTDPVTYMEVRYAYSKADSDKMESELNAKVNEIMSHRPAGATTFETVRYFHDTIINNCTYDKTAAYCRTAYGALVDGKALCQGYSQAMALLCSRAGIENCVVTGFAGEEHMWNMIKMDTGWYHVDVTWDDPKINGEYNFLIYDYFGLTDAEILAARTVHPGVVSFPKAVNTAENYFVYKKLYAASYEQAKDILYRGFLNAANSGNDKVYIRFADNALYEEACDKLFNQYDIYDIQKKASNAASRSFISNQTSYIKNPDRNTIVFMVIY